MFDKIEIFPCVFHRFFKNFASVTHRNDKETPDWLHQWHEVAKHFFSVFNKKELA